jgi:addiction module HigA family antidote
MTPLGLSINGLARDLRVPVTRISEIVNGRRSITADTALRLARYFAMTPQFWMNLQAAYDLIRDVLAGLDAELHECASAEEAFPFGVDASDWVLMDIELHGLDGISATRIIRSVSPGTKVCNHRGRGSSKPR